MERHKNTDQAFNAYTVFTGTIHVATALLLPWICASANCIVAAQCGNGGMMQWQPHLAATGIEINQLRPLNEALFLPSRCVKEKHCSNSVCVATQPAALLWMPGMQVKAAICVCVYTCGWNKCSKAMLWCSFQ